jgi:hypothetical protein
MIKKIICIRTTLIVVSSLLFNQLIAINANLQVSKTLRCNKIQRGDNERSNTEITQSNGSFVLLYGCKT